ncbi:MAG: helix-turn-helix transcriptional regulator, partial [Planctomycetota bacterium]
MQLMSIGDLAAYLGDSKRTIYKYIASGDCPPYIRISAKNIKFDRADVDAWLESKKINPTPGAWTPRAQAVLERAQKQARRDGFDLTGTEHVLFGIVSVKDCLGAEILKNLGVAPCKYYQRYEQLPKPTDAKSPGKAEFSEALDKVIQCAYDQATQWSHTYIGSEH